MSHILTSLHGRKLGLDVTGKLIMPAGSRSGYDGNQFDGQSPSTVVLLDDFNGVSLNASAWGTNKGGDASALGFALNPGADDGGIIGTCGLNAALSMATNGIEITSGLQWKAGDGALVFQTKLQLQTAANIALFAGFTNALAATLEAPITASGVANGLTANAADCVGLMYDTAMATDVFWGVGAKGGVIASAVNTGVAPLAATNVILRVEIDKNGWARFWVNGIMLGGATDPMGGAVTGNVALTPVIAAFTRSAATQTVSVDYIHVSKLRQPN